jgi:TetR/AcrR family transcriptional regulator, transcriptional repressor for nem operon
MKKRTVKEPGVRRDEILDSARKLIFTKGYEQMTVQDILDDLHIAKGTLYHYFDSKHSLLEALIKRIQLETEKSLLPILQDPQKNAVQKLQGFFDGLDALRTAHMPGVVQLARVWYNDDNTLVREKVNAAVLEQRAPLLAQIVEQGFNEGVFTTRYAKYSGEIILSLLQGMGSAHMRLLFALDEGLDEILCAQEIRTTQAAYMDAVERVLGAEANSLYRLDPAAVKAWVTAFKEAGKQTF